MCQRTQHQPDDEAHGCTDAGAKKHADVGRQGGGGFRRPVEQLPEERRRTCLIPRGDGSPGGGSERGTWTVRWWTDHQHPTSDLVRTTSLAGRPAHQAAQQVRMVAHNIVLSDTERTRLTSSSEKRET